MARAGASPEAAAGHRRGGRLPLKAEYGPTLGTLIAERWRRLGTTMRRSLLALGALAAVACVALLLSVQSPRYSHGGPVPFSFSYKGMQRVAPEAGGYVRVERSAGGRLVESFAVAPLAIPPYRGSVGAAFPLAAAANISQLGSRFQAFKLVAEGPVRTSAFGSWEELPPSTVYYHVPTYSIAFRALARGVPVLGREIWLVGNRPGADQGVSILMLAAARAQATTSPLSLGTSGSLEGALRSFELG